MIHLSEALAAVTDAVAELLDHDGKAESNVPLMQRDHTELSNFVCDRYMELRFFPRQDEVDPTTYAKGLFRLYMGNSCPSDEPFIPGGHSPLDVQAGFAVAAARYGR